jgi:hypothetical protein
MKSEPGPPLRRHFVTPKVAQVPMTLGGAAATRVRFIVWCLPFGEPHGFAGCKASAISPLRRHFVPPKVAQVPIPPKWRDDSLAAKSLDTPPPADTTGCRAGGVVVHNQVNQKNSGTYKPVEPRFAGR